MSHARRARLLPISALLAAAIVTAAALPAQTLEQHLTRAEQHAGKGEDEAAALELRQARRLAERIEDPREQRQQLAAIRSRMQKLDPLDRKLQPRREKVVADLLQAAGEYLERGWKATALPLLRAAELIEPGCAGALLAEATSPAPAAAGSDDGIGAFFRDAENYGDRWQLADDEVTSPAITDHSLMLVTRQALEGDHRLTVDVLLGKQPAKVGLVVGHDLDWQRQTYCIVELVRAIDHTALRVLEAEGGKAGMENIGQQYADETPADREEWVRLVVELRDGQLTAHAGELKVGPLRPEHAPLPGAIGFYISSDSLNRAPLRFRNFVAESL